MANFFDQFDAPAAPAVPQKNFFDQFDAPAAPLPGNDAANPMVPHADGSAPEAANPWLDTAASLGSGVVRGTAEMAMLPATINRAGQAGVGWGMDRGEDLIRSIMGAPPVTDAERAQRQQIVQQTTSPLDKLINSGQDAVRGQMDEHLYAPKTTPGHFAETIGEFLVPGGWPSEATRLAPTAARKFGEYIADLTRNAVIPGAASEAAGQVTQGTPAEPIARVAGGLAGNVATSAAAAANAPESVLRRAVGDPSQIDWAKALQIQNNPTGIRLTGPEAISQAQNGGTALTNLQRVIEGSIEGQAIMSPFFAARPGQVDTAVNSVLDSIAPQSATPSVLGPRVSDAATTAIRDVEKERTAAVDPLYKAAASDTVPTDQVQSILDNIASTAAADKSGILSGPLNDLHSRLIADKGKPAVAATRTPVLGPDGQVIRYTSTPFEPAVPSTPSVDVETLDRIRKYFRDRMDLPQTGQDAITKEQNAAVSGYLDQLNAAMEANSPAFGAAKDQYADISRNVVQPIAEGPLGQVAKAKDTPTAGEALLPHNPMVGSEGESADAIARLVMQDAGSTQGTVRQNLADRYSRASTETQQGDATFGGAKYHKDIAGNAQREATLSAVLDALNAPEAAQGMDYLREALQATGRRKQIGSATEFNRSFNEDLGANSPKSAIMTFVKALGTSLPTQVTDAAKRAAQRNSTSALANMFSDPASVELIQQAIARGPKTTMPSALMRSVVQSLTQAGGQ